MSRQRTKSLNNDVTVVLAFAILKKIVLCFTGQSSACEYGCERSTGNCFHFKQENHYHQYNVQVGDNSRFEVHAHGGT